PLLRPQWSARASLDTASAAAAKVRLSVVRMVIPGYHDRFVDLHFVGPHSRSSPHAADFEASAVVGRAAPGADVARRSAVTMPALTRGGGGRAKKTIPRSAGSRPRDDLANRPMDASARSHALPAVKRTRISGNARRPPAPRAKTRPT